MKHDGIRRSRAGCLAGFIPLALICLETVSVLSQDASLARTRAPDWESTDLSDKRVKFPDFRGHVLIVDFWATWCAACRLEIPDFVELQKQYGDKGLTVIGVSLDEQGPDVVKKFVKQFGVNYPIVIGNEKAAEAYGRIDVIPTTFVIDRAILHSTSICALFNLMNRLVNGLGVEAAESYTKLAAQRLAQNGYAQLLNFLAATR